LLGELTSLKSKWWVQLLPLLPLICLLSPLVYNHTTCYIILISPWSAYYLPLSTSTLLVILFLTILMALSSIDQPIISPCLQPHYLLYHSYQCYTVGIIFHWSAYYLPLSTKGYNWDLLIFYKNWYHASEPLRKVSLPIVNF
jgi:hypothetical protein